jgi:hypothetical protein
MLTVESLAMRSSLMLGAWCVVLLTSRAEAASGGARADSTPPSSFPHRIWAACDFEGRTPDYGWFGAAETNSIPAYPGHRTALRANPGPYGKTSAVMAGVNPVPGPRMGTENGLFVRYFFQGGSNATFQHFSLTREDNWHINVSNLTEGRWDSLTLNFTRDAVRNDGSSERFGQGERMDDFKVFAGPPADAARYRLLLDDVIFFANEPGRPPEPERFPRRVLFLAAFDTGEKSKYWPGDFSIVETNLPAGSYWRVARSVPRPRGGNPMVRLQIEPPRPVGPHTKLRFRYHLTGEASLTVQLFDATVQDNRHIRLPTPRQGEWVTLYLDFSRDSRRNDGTSNSSFSAGNLVDDLFFLVDGSNAKNAALLIDEVVLYDGEF